MSRATAGAKATAANPEPAK